MHYTCVEFNTDENNEPVPEDISEEKQPRCYFGPFDTAEAADHWMMYDYPDGDKDVRDMYRLETDDPETLGYINPPSLVHS